ncbi:hypothetical protein ACFVUS_25290 [Nocardia sp. NPDC058058]|uniref:hypothetical protein n=1 Tax=Nocardia sp. NPDC058058 TaxID=3346317 RepID=UPI0036D8173E
MRAHLRRFRSTYSFAALALATAGMVAAGTTTANAAGYLYDVSGNTAPGGSFSGSSPHPMFRNGTSANLLSCATGTFSGSMPNVSNSTGVIGTFSGYTFSQCTMPSGATATVTATVRPAPLTVTGGAEISGKLPAGTLSVRIESPTCSYTLAQTTVLNWSINHGNGFQLMGTLTPQDVKGSCNLVPPILFAHGGSFQPTVTSHPA